MEYSSALDTDLRKIASKLVGSTNHPHYDDIFQEMRLAVLELIASGKDVNESYARDRAKRRAIGYLRKERLWEKTTPITVEELEACHDEDDDTMDLVDIFEENEKRWKSGEGLQ